MKENALYIVKQKTKTTIALTLTDEGEVMINVRDQTSNANTNISKSLNTKDGDKTTTQKKSEHKQTEKRPNSSNVNTQTTIETAKKAILTSNSNSPEKCNKEKKKQAEKSKSSKNDQRQATRCSTKTSTDKTTVKTRAKGSNPRDDVDIMKILNQCTSNTNPVISKFGFSNSWFYYVKIVQPAMRPSMSMSTANSCCDKNNQFLVYRRAVGSKEGKGSIVQVNLGAKRNDLSSKNLVLIGDSKATNYNCNSTPVITSRECELTTKPITYELKEGDFWFVGNGDDSDKLISISKAGYNVYNKRKKCWLLNSNITDSNISVSSQSGAVLLLSCNLLVISTSNYLHFHDLTDLKNPQLIKTDKTKHRYVGHCMSLIDYTYTCDNAKQVWKFTFILFGGKQGTSSRQSLENNISPVDVTFERFINKDGVNTCDLQVRMLKKPKFMSTDVISPLKLSKSLKVVRYRDYRRVSYTQQCVINQYNERIIIIFHSTFVILYNCDLQVICASNLVKFEIIIILYVGHVFVCRVTHSCLLVSL